MDDKKPYREMNREELVERVRSLESENSTLLRFKQDLKQQELERSIIHEQLQFSWAGNLGRWEWNCKTGQVIFNPKKVQVLGYEVAEFSPTLEAFTGLLHPDDYEPTMDAMRQHLYGKVPAYEAEYRIRTREGNYKWFYDRGRIMEYDENGKPLRLTGIVFDITEQKEFEARLAEANRQLKAANDAKNKVFSIIAHDLRNPFASIISFINLLEQEDVEMSEEEYSYVIKELKKITTNTDLLLQNLLAWARSQSEGIQVNAQQIGLKPSIDLVCNLFESLVKSKGITLEKEIDPQLKAIVDEHMLQTVLRNLISNAVKFSHPDQAIVIRAEQQGDKALISVSDRGVGIDSEHINKLFDIGAVFSTSGTREEQGTGLGLKLSNELIKRNQGRMWVSSQAGQGSTFYISLPVASG